MSLSGCEEITENISWLAFQVQGAFGQSVIVDPTHERILIIFRYKAQEESYRAIGRLFSRWVRTPPVQ